MFKFSTRAFFLLSIALTSCSSHMAVLQQDKHEHSVAYNEMRSEIADLKHSLNSVQVEMQILEEQVQNQENAAKKLKSTPSASDPKVVQLEKRIAAIEQMQEKIYTDMKQLSSHANQTTSCLQQYSSKISEIEQNIERQKQLIRDIGDLKASLKTFTTNLSSEEKNGARTYKVKAGDSLEKIAKNHKVSVDSLKKANQLSQNKILIGQELIIP